MHTSFQVSILILKLPKLILFANVVMLTKWFSRTFQENLNGIKFISEKFKVLFLSKSILI